jgi:isopentenyldiphosphate isomerase
MELFDRVNEKDEVIGVTNKAEAHEHGYAHRVAAVYVFNSKSELLVQLRKKDGYLDHSVGGHVKKDESYNDAAKRESFEELGFSKDLTEVGVFYSNERMPGRSNIVHYFGLYEVQLNDDEVNSLILASDEVEKLIPMTLEDIADDMRKNIKKYTLGFVSSLNFYITSRGLNIPIVKFK